MGGIVDLIRTGSGLWFGVRCLASSDWSLLIQVVTVQEILPGVSVEPLLGDLPGGHGGLDGALLLPQWCEMCCTYAGHRVGKGVVPVCNSL